MNFENMRRGSVHHSIIPGNASTDGDYVALREARKKHSAVLDTGHEKKVKFTTIVQTPDKQAEFRQKVFDAIVSDSVDTFETAVGQLKFTDPTLIDPTSKQNVLHYALDNGKITVAKYILQNCDNDILCADFEVICGGIHAKKNALHQITWMKDLRLARFFLGFVTNRSKQKELIVRETPVEITGQRPRSFSCLHMAAFLGSEDLVELFLDFDTDTNMLNAKNDTPLLWAARWGHENTVHLLLSRGANANLENDKGSTALYWAVRYGHYNTAKLLIEMGKADVNKTRKLGLVAPIVLAAALGDDQTVRLLIDNGANPNQVIRGQERPLHHAAREGHADVVETLIVRGATIDAKNERGDTPLIEAAVQDNVMVVDMLLKYKADLSHKNHEGNDAWTAAIEATGNEVVNVLLKYQSTQHQRENTRPPLCIAASLGMEDKVDKLLGLKLNPNDTDYKGNNFIHCAALNNNYEIIEKFHKEVSINAKNKEGNTALHIACMKGHHEAVEAITKAKAKADIKNGRGDTALHSAARSKFILPETVQLLIEHVIKTHAWTSLHTTDAGGQNALHIAGQIAKPDVIWEFRFVRLKDQDLNGETPLHDSVRPGEPEAIEKMLDIYETVKRDADINTQNNKKLTVLHIAAMQGYDNAVRRLILYGADLSLQEASGNTVLHQLVEDSIRDSRNSEQYIVTFNVILEEAVRWYCMKTKIQYPEANIDLYYEYKHTAVLHLTNDILNEGNLSVIAYAFKLGARDVVDTLLMMHRVTKFTHESSVLFDITKVTPTTNYSSTGCCGSGKKDPTYSCLEYLVSNESPHRAAKVLDSPPMREIERMYESVAAYCFLILMLLHIIYMGVFTYVGNALQEDARSNQTFEVNTTAIIMFVVVPLEPAIILFYTCYAIYRHCYINGCSCHITRYSIRSMFLVLVGLLWNSIPVLYAALVVTWIILYTMSYHYQDHVLAVGLLLGWILSIGFTRGFKTINYFWKMLQSMIVRDIYRFLIVYLFVLLGFAFALHAIFQISKPIADQYASPGDTLFLVFNLMIGMGEIFDDNFESGMTAIGRGTAFVKIVYVLYMVLATIILLNLLIAMMNDSYSTILAEHQVSWRLNSVSLGISIEKLFPFTSKIFTAVKLQRGLGIIDGNNENEERWYVGVSNDRLQKSTLEKIETDDVMSTLTQKIETMDERLRRVEQHMTSKMMSNISEMRSQLKNISSTLQESRYEARFDGAVRETETETETEV